jgi:hypothetical protein
MSSNDDEREYEDLSDILNNAFNSDWFTTIPTDNFTSCNQPDFAGCFHTEPPTQSEPENAKVLQDNTIPTLEEVYASVKTPKRIGRPPLPMEVRRERRAEHARIQRERKNRYQIYMENELCLLREQLAGSQAAVEYLVSNLSFILRQESPDEGEIENAWGALKSFCDTYTKK